MKKMLESLAIYYHELYGKSPIDQQVYKKAFVLIGDILDHMDENVPVEYKIYFKEIAEALLAMDVPDVDNSLGDRLYDEVMSIICDIKTMDDVVKNAVLPKICPSFVIGNSLYESAHELFVDFKRYITRKSSVVPRMREKIYSYMYYIAKEILLLMEEYAVTPKDWDEEVLVWMLEQVLRTKQFQDAFTAIDNESKLSDQREEALYLKVGYKFN